MNILLIFPDQHRQDWLPGDPRLPVEMPHMARLMARGTRFVNAFTPSPICAPARACLASGRSYDDCGVPDNGTDYPLDQPTYYQSLRDYGYRVAGVGKFDLHKATQDWGLDGSRLLEEWGFTDGIDNEGKIDAVASGAEHPTGPYMSFLHREGLAQTHVEDFRQRRGPIRSYTNTQPTPLPEHAYCDNWIAENAERALDQFPTGEPWHLVVNFTGPHNPMDVTAQMQEPWVDVQFPGPVANDQVDDETHQRVRRNYAAMLQNIDTRVGRLLGVVAERDELDRTLVVYSSDHGEMLGDHNRWAKSVHHRPSVGVPLVVAGPGVEQGHTTDALVALQDLTATFLETAGCPALEGMDGASLWPVLRGGHDQHRSHVVSGLGSWRRVFDGSSTLVTGARADRTSLLFDAHEDPFEMHDVAAERPDEARRMAHLLDTSPWS